MEFCAENPMQGGVRGRRMECAYAFLLAPFTPKFPVELTGSFTILSVNWRVES